jgi:ubiquinone/menaquinone biosynthesis C-methylase UbiE
MKLDFGSGYNPAHGYKTCDCTGNPMLDYHFDAVKYRIADCRASTFDLIRCKNVIHHVPDIKKLFIELVRVLKPKGSLLIIEPTPKAYPVNVFLDTLWYRSIIPREEVWFSSVWRDYRNILTESQMSVILEFVNNTGDKLITVAKKNICKTS